MQTLLNSQNDPGSVIDRPIALDCPHCLARSNVTAVSIPGYEQVKRYNLKKVIVAYRCDSCNTPIALRFDVSENLGNSRAFISSEYEELERPMETFDYQHLPTEVAADFREALTCYSQSCLNATAAMIRRTVQSIATNLGAGGSDKVTRQILEIKDTAGIDEATFAGLKQIIIDGHDGAHPHLPTMSKTRAAVLVELMKDVLYQLYVRKAKIQEAMRLRQEAIDAKKSPLPTGN